MELVSSLISFIVGYYALKGYRARALLYDANLSYDRLMKHLNQLIELGPVHREKEGDEVVSKLTDKGRTFVLEFVKVEKFAEALGITS